MHGTSSSVVSLLPLSDCGRLFLEGLQGEGTDLGVRRWFVNGGLALNWSSGGLNVISLGL